MAATSLQYEASLMPFILKMPPNLPLDDNIKLPFGDDFTVELTDLAANTTYIVRPYATNDAGTGYGESVKFTTTHKRFRWS